MIVDILILIFLLFGVLFGLKNGFTKTLVSTVGSVLVIILAFIFKNPLANILMNVFPFFDFGGLSALNIMLYQMVSFIILIIVLGIILRILLYSTSIFEKILNMTIILGFISKILGGVVGLIRNYIIVFIVLYVLSFPFFNFKFLEDSKMTKFILDKSLILSKVASQTTNVTDDLKALANDKSNNKKAMDLLVKYDLIKDEDLQKLIEKGKVKE